MYLQLRSTLVCLILILLLVTLPGCGGEGAGDGRSSGGSGDGSGAVNVGVVINPGPGTPIPPGGLDVNAVRFIRLTVLNGATLADAPLASTSIDLLVDEVREPLLLPGVPAGEYLFLLQALDANEAVLGQDTRLFPLVPGLTTPIDSVVDPEGIRFRFRGVVLQAGPVTATPPVIRPGQTAVISFDTTNTGDESASNVRLRISLTRGGADVSALFSAAATPPSTRIPAGDTRKLSFGLTAAGGAAPGPVSLNITVLEGAGNVGAITTGALQLNPTLVDISGPFAVTAQAMAFAGETFRVSVAVSNTGQAEVRTVVTDLVFTDPSGLTVTKVSHPDRVPGTGSATFNFDVAIAAGAATGSRTFAVTLSGVDSSTGLAVTANRPGSGTVLLERAAVLTVTSVVAPPSVNRGQSVPITIGLSNSGSTVARIESIVPLSGLLTLQGGAALPFDLPGGGSSTLTLTGATAQTAPFGTSAIQVEALGRDLTRGNALTASGPASGSTLVQTTATLSLGDLGLENPFGIDSAGPAIPVTFAVTNRNPNGAALRFSQARLTLTTASPADSHYRVTAPPDLMTRSIAGGTTERFVFQVAALATAPRFATTFLQVSVTAVDQNDGTTSAVSATGAWFVREAADRVLGQTDLRSSAPNRSAIPSASSMNLPLAVVSDGTGVVVADSRNNRVLAFDSFAAPAATLVLGQAGFTTSGSGGGASDLRDPGGVAIQGTGILVADTGNNRIVIHDGVLAAPVSGRPGDRFLGQPDGVSTSPNRGGLVAVNTLSAPTGLTMAGASLVVADTGNHRVLIFRDLAVLATGASADVVLGQANGTVALSNRGGTAGAETLSSPAAVAVTGDTLLVADSGNNRVLIFPGFATLTSGAAATGVLGKASFTDTSPDNGAGQTVPTGLNRPEGLVFFGDRLYIADTVNNRVVEHVFNVSSPPGAAPVSVLGQRNLVEGTANNAVFAPVDGFSLFAPSGVATLTSGAVVVADTVNHRVLRIPRP